MNERIRSRASRNVRFCWSLMKLGLAVIAVCTVVGGVYLYNRVDEEIRAHVEAIFARHYTGLTVSVHSAHVEREGFEIRGLSISEQTDESSRTELAYFDEIHVRCHPTLKGLLGRNLDIRHVTVRRLVIRLARRWDGTWNLSRLFPLPRFGDSPPAITIENATIEIVDSAQATPRMLTLRSVNLELIPDGDQAAARDLTDGAPRRLRIKGSLAGDHIQSADVQGLIDLEGGAWSLRGKVNQLAISPELRQSLPADLGRRLEPLGSLRSRGTFDFHVHGNRNRKDALQYRVFGQMSDGRVDDQRLSYPLTDLQATVDFDNHSLRVENLTARYGPATLQLSGTKQGFSGNSPMAIWGTVRKLRLERKIVDLLPEQVRAGWFKFQPIGLVNADFRFDFDGRRWQPELAVTCLDLSLKYFKFPYPLHGGTGTVTLKNQQLQFTGFRLLAGNCPIHIEGNIAQPGADWSGQLTIKTAGRLPLDGSLIDANKESVRRIIREFNARGWVTLATSLQREKVRGAPIRQEIVVQLHDCSLQHAKFPYPLYQVGGTLSMKDGRWLFTDLHGRNDSGYVTCRGHWDPHAPGEELVLKFEAHQVPLEDELRDALHARDKALWTAFQPRGTVDRIDATLRYSKADRKTALDIRLTQRRRNQDSEGRSISIHPVWFPYRVDELTGSIHIQDGYVAMTQLRALHGQVTIAIPEGNVQLRPDGGWELRFDRLIVDQLRPAEEDFLQALPARLRQGLARLNLNGPINIDGSLVLARENRADALVSSNWNVIVNLAEGSLRCGIDLDQITGDVQLIGNSDGRSFHSRGKLNIDSVRYRGIHFTQVRGPIWLDDSGLRLGAWAEAAGTNQPRQRLHASVFGGTVAGEAQVWFTQAGQFELQANLNDADLAEVVRQVSRRPPSVRGRAFATLQLAGNGQGTHSLRGRGKIGLRDAEIYELPLIVSLLKMLRAGTPDKTAFTTADITFQVQGDHVYFDEIDLSGDAVSLKGNGDMNLNREIQLDFYSLLGRERDYIPALLPFLGEASRRFLQIHVTGTLDEPRLSQKVLPMLNETLQHLFPETGIGLDGRSAINTKRRAGREGIRLFGSR